MAGVVLTERLDIDRITYLLQTFKLIDYAEHFTGAKSEMKKSYDSIMKFLKLRKYDLDGVVKYDYMNGRTNGRLFAKGGIQGLPRIIRGFLCDSFTTDIDMVNAHPSILYHLCKEKEIECVNLHHYLTNRESVLEDICDKDHISREEAKTKILISTNLNKRIATGSDMLRRYDTEMKRIHKAFLPMDDFAYIRDIARKDSGNFEGSFINHILCIKENEILTIMRNTLKEYGIEIHSLMFDGLMVYGDYYSNQDLLRAMEYDILNETGWEINLAYKEHHIVFEVPDDFEALDCNYQSVKEKFELQNCKVNDLFIVDKLGEISIYKKTSFQTIHEAIFYSPDGIKQEQFLKKWFLDPNKREYDKIDVYPNREDCPTNVFNMWKPFPVESFTETTDLTEGLDFFLDHIKVLVNYDEPSYELVCKWIAQMFQYPHIKSFELVFSSEEGAGKGLFLEFFKTMLGGDRRCWETTDPQNEVFGHFNGYMKDAFLVVFNETNKSFFFNAGDKKKAIITDSTININIKGIPQQTIRSFHRFLSFTNHADPMAPSKRRNAFFNCSSDKINNTAYFNKGFSFAKDRAVCKAIYDYFMKYPTKAKLTREDIPITEYHKEVIEANKDPLTLFLETYFKQQDKDHRISVDMFFMTFDTYCKEENLLHRETKKGLGLKIYHRHIDGITKIKSDYWIYHFEVDKIKKHLGL